MVEPTQTDSSLVVPFGEGRAIVVGAGQTLTVRQGAAGGQVGDLNAWNSHDAREKLWSSRTALHHGMHVTTGDRLYSTWPGERPILTVVDDTIAGRTTPRGAMQHDVVLGRCSRKFRIHRYGADTPGCQENLAAAVAPFDLGPGDIHDALNLFMYTGRDEDDQLFLEPTDAGPDDRISLLAEIDCLVAISACPGACSAPGATGLLCDITGP